MVPDPLRLDAQRILTLRPRALLVRPRYRINARMAMLIVAASNAPVQVKAAADYVCDGTNDEVDIQAAIDVGTGQVLLSEGTFQTSAAVNLASNVHILGMGMGVTTIQPQSNYTYVFRNNGVSRSDIRIADMTLDMAATTTEAIGFTTAMGNRVTIKRVYSIGGDIDADFATTLFLIDNHVTNAVLRVSQGTNVVIRGNTVIYTSGSGVCILAGTCTNVSITGNVARGTGGSGIDVGSSARVTIAGNTVHDCQNGVWCEESAATSQDIVIVGNYLEGRTGVGITIGDGVDRVVIGGNHISDFDWGILLDGATRYVNISGNVLELQDSDSIYLRDTTNGYPQDCIINGNLIFDGAQVATGHGIRLRGCNYITTQNNYIRGTTFAYAIREDDGAFGGNTSQNISFEGNDLGGTYVTGPLLLNGTGASRKPNRNLGYLTENSGTATILSGTTSVVVTHGLSATPAAKDISITLTENSTNDSGNVWVDTITATQFTVNVRSDPGASNLDLAWQAIIL